MHHRRVLPILFTISLFALKADVLADVVVEELRHITRDDQGQFRHYGCQPCTLPFSPLPPGSLFSGASAPATATYSATSSTSLNPFELSASTQVDVSVDESGGGTEGWNRAEMHVEVEVDYIDTAFVTGVPNGQTGFVSLGWVLTGEHTLHLDTTNPIGPNTVNVPLLETSVVLSADEAAMGGIPPIDPLDSTNDYPGSGSLPFPQSMNENFVQNVPDVSDVLFFAVPFTQGTTFVIDFTLSIYGDVEIGNLDAPMFSTSLGADFSNTASIMVVDIVDDLGQSLPGAELNSTSFNAIYPTAIPEPSALTCLGFVLVCGCSVSRLRRYRRVAAASQLKDLPGGLVN